MAKRKEVKPAFLRASIQEMKGKQVARHIGEDRLAMIRAQDNQPLFIGIRLAQEGVSSGEWMGKGNQEKFWPKSAILSLSRALNQGSPGIFKAHRPDLVGSDERPPAGRVLSSYTNMINGRLAAEAISYIEDGQARERIKSGHFDSASIEADIELTRADDGGWIVSDVLKATGVALANSDEETPGFAGSGITAVIQELEKGENEKMGEEDIKKAMQGLSAAQIRGIVAGLDRAPSDLFTQGELEGDASVKRLVSDAAGDSGKKLETAQEDLTKAQAEITTLKKSSLGSLVSVAAAKRIEATEGLSAAEAKHVLAAIERRSFTAEAGTDLDADVSKAVDEEVQGVSDLRKLYGKEPIKSAPPEEERKKKGTDKDEEDGGDKDEFLTDIGADKDGKLLPAKAA